MLGDQNSQENEEHHFGLQFPNKGYVVNLSPADLPKHSTGYDLAVAVGVLAATDQIPLPALEKSLFIGELSLAGSIRHVKGVMPMVYAAMQAGFETVYVPMEDAPQAALVSGIDIVPLQSLGQLVEHLYGLNPIAPHTPEPTILNPVVADGLVDYAEIKGLIFPLPKLPFPLCPLEFWSTNR